MKPLDVDLRRVEDLRKETFADIVIQEEEGHLGTVMRYPHQDRSFRYYDMEDEPYETTDWIVDKSRISEPDIKKREAAMTELQRIREDSDWIAARYKARSILEHWGYVETDNEFDSWFDELKDRLGGRIHSLEESYCVKKDLRTLYENDVPANSKLRKRAGELLGINEADILGHELTISSKLGRAWNRGQTEMVYQNATHVEYRKLASQLIGISPVDFLTDELHRDEELSRPQLQEIYRQATNQEDMVFAGRCLGYSMARILTHKKLSQVKGFLSQ